MRTATFSVDAPAIVKEIARNLTGVGNAGMIMALGVLLGGLAQIAIRAHKINDREIIRILNSMGITREYVGDDLLASAVSGDISDAVASSIPTDPDRNCTP